MPLLLFSVLTPSFPLTGDTLKSWKRIHRDQWLLAFVHVTILRQIFSCLLSNQGCQKSQLRTATSSLSPRVMMLQLSIPYGTLPFLFAMSQISRLESSTGQMESLCTSSLPGGQWVQLKQRLRPGHSHGLIHQAFLSVGLALLRVPRKCMS